MHNCTCAMYHRIAHVFFPLRYSKCVTPLVLPSRLHGNKGHVLFHVSPCPASFFPPSIHVKKKKKVLHPQQQTLEPIKLNIMPIVSPFHLKLPLILHWTAFFFLIESPSACGDGGKMRIDTVPSVHRSFYLDVGRVSAVARVREPAPSLRHDEWLWLLSTLVIWLHARPVNITTLEFKKKKKVVYSTSNPRVKGKKTWPNEVTKRSRLRKTEKKFALESEHHFGQSRPRQLRPLLGRWQAGFRRRQGYVHILYTCCCWRARMGGEVWTK